MPIAILTSDQITAWLSSAQQVEDPREAPLDEEPPIHIEFYAPARCMQIEAFVRTFLTDVIRSGNILVHITDFTPSDEARDFVFRSLWTAAGESRPFYETPSCEIPEADWEHAVALFALAASFGWKSYLYGTADQTILYNWEGEIFDFWTSSRERADSLVRILQNFELKQLEEKA